MDAGDPDRALDIFFPATGIVDEEVRILRSVPEVWTRVRDGVCPVPRELRTAPGSIDRLNSAVPVDIPTLYLYGEATQAPIFATTAEVTTLLPNAQLHGLVKQRHLAFAFEPATFADAVLEFTTAHDR